MEEGGREMEGKGKEEKEGKEGTKMVREGEEEEGKGKERRDGEIIEDGEEGKGR